MMQRLEDLQLRKRSREKHPKRALPLRISQKNQNNNKNNSHPRLLLLSQLKRTFQISAKWISELARSLELLRIQTQISSIMNKLTLEMAKSG